MPPQESNFASLVADSYRPEGRGLNQQGKVIKMSGPQPSGEAIPQTYLAWRRFF